MAPQNFNIFLYIYTGLKKKLYIHIHITYVAILLTPRHTDALNVLAIHKNRYVIFESSKRELLESVNCVFNVKKI
jgi:hypothetical protein